MDRLPEDVWKHHLTVHLSDADFVHLVTTCRSYYYRYSRCKRIKTRYPISQIHQIVHCYDFSQIYYDLKIFRPEYLPWNLDRIDFWYPPIIEQNKMSLVSYPRRIICQTGCPHILCSTRLQSLKTEVWHKHWIYTLTYLADLRLRIYEIWNIRELDFSGWKLLTRLSVRGLPSQCSVTLPPQLENLELNKFSKITFSSLERLTSLEISVQKIPDLGNLNGPYLKRLRVLKLNDLDAYNENEVVHGLLLQIIRKIPELIVLEEFRIFSKISSLRKIFIRSKSLCKLKLIINFNDPIIKINAPYLTKLSVKNLFSDGDDYLTARNFKIRTPILHSISVNMSLDGQFIKKLEDQLIPQLTHLHVLKLVSTRLHLDVHKLGTQMESIKLYRLDNLSDTSPFTRMTRLTSLLLYEVLQTPGFFVSGLLNSLTRLELINISNRKLYVPCRLRELSISYASRLTKLILPNTLTYLNIYECPKLRIMNLPISILKIEYRFSHPETLQKIKQYITNSQRYIRYNFY